MTSSREKIFQKLRGVLPESSPLPDLPPHGPWQTFDDPYSRFCEVLDSVGGECHRVPNISAANDFLQNVEEWKAAKVRASVVEGLGDSTIDLNNVESPHDLENVDYAVLRGHFGVAENAAIWVTDDTVRHRVMFFIPQRLAVVIPAAEIVNNMHEAYARIDVKDNTFAAFISGPSKTADIEQSLVIGAHGARSLIVFAVDDPGSNV